MVTSKIESFSNVIIEGMSYGCVPISFDIIGPRSIIVNWKNGVLIKNADIDEFVENLHKLCIIDLTELSINCINTSKTYTKNYIMSKWKNIISEVI